MTDQGLYAALVAVQSEMPIVHKGETADTGKFRYSYADLASISAAITPILTKHGIAYVCHPARCDDGSYELQASIIHTSGERIVGALPLFGRTPQEIGSSITYGRRYLLGCLVGVITDNDDAATVGAYRASATRPPRMQPAEPQPPAQPADDGTPMSDTTRAALFATLHEKGIDDEDEQRSRMSKFLGRPVESRGDLTEDEARRIIHAIKGR